VELTRYFCLIDMTDGHLSALAKVGNFWMNSSPVNFNMDVYLLALY